MEAGLRPEHLGDDHRALHQPVEHVEQVELVELLVGAHRLDHRQVEVAGEHREALEQQPLVVVEQLMRPGDGVAQRGVTIALGRTAAQHPEPLVEPSVEISRRERSAAGGRELDRERQTVEPLAQGDDRIHRAGREVERRIRVLRAVDEQLHGRRIGVVSGERLDRQRRLTGKPERLAAGGEDLEIGAAVEQRPDRAGRRVDQMLTVVDHQDGGLIADRLDRRPQRLLARLRRGTHAVEQRERDALFVEHGGEFDEPHTAVGSTGRVGGGLDGERGLAHTAGPTDGDQSVFAQQVADVQQIALPADEVDRADRQRGLGLVEGLQRRERRR